MLDMILNDSIKNIIHDAFSQSESFTYCAVLSFTFSHCKKHTIVDLKENQQSLIKQQTFYQQENNQFHTNVDIRIKV